MGELFNLEGIIKKCIVDKSILTKIIYRYKWTVPITYITNKKSQSTLVWFDKDASECENFGFIIYAFRESRYFFCVKFTFIVQY